MEEFKKTHILVSTSDVERLLEERKGKRDDTIKMQLSERACDDVDSQSIHLSEDRVLPVY
jgi:hypothetical protein